MSAATASCRSGELIGRPSYRPVPHLVRLFSSEQAQGFVLAPAFLCAFGTPHVQPVRQVVNGVVRRHYQPGSMCRRCDAVQPIALKTHETSARQDFRAAAARGRVRRAARRHVEIARQQIRIGRRRNARRIAAAAGAAVDVLVVRALDGVGAGQSFDRRRVLVRRASSGVRSSSRCATTWMTSDSCCSSPVDRDIARAQHDRPEALERLRPDDDVGDRGLVLDGHEDDALRGARPLADGDEAGDGDARAGTLRAQLLVADDAAAGEVGAQERGRMRAQRQLRGSGSR